jgi:hypothetical protein
VFDLSLSVGQHCYGLNLATASLMVQVDSEINRRNEDRFQITGLAFEGRPPSGVYAQKVAGQKILTDLIAGWYPVGTRPGIITTLVPRHNPSLNLNTLPPIIFVFSDCHVAAQIRSHILTHVRASQQPAVRKWWVEPVLTKATHVRIEIMQAICRALAGSVMRCNVQSRIRAPLLFVSSVGGEKVYGFVEACQAFGHMLTTDRLNFAYRSARRFFQSRLAASFLVLRDGYQPVANFFVPTPRVVVANPAVVDVVDTGDAAPVVIPAVLTGMPPPVLPNYLQRTLSAPVPSVSGSGRKRPAEGLESVSKR